MKEKEHGAGNGMEELRAGNQVIRYDAERNRRAYAQVARGGAEDCACVHCRNFAAQREAAYPADFRAMLELLGIDYRKEEESYDLHSADGQVLYGGWFFLAGEMVVIGENLEKEIGSEFKFSFRDARRLRIPDEDFGEQLLALDFVTTLPWVVGREA